MKHTSATANMRNTFARTPGEQVSLGSYATYVEAQGGID
jgi:hypothetical protein